MPLQKQKQSFFILGTDTNVGKTISSALLLSQYSQLRYWKPVQTGSDSDSSKIKQLTGFPKERFLTECYSFLAPLSPHRAAELENKSIDFEKLCRAYQQNEAKAPLLIEGAGGLLVPLTRKHTWLNFLEQTKLSVIIVARTTLGTINHSLLTAQILKHHNIPTLGFIFCGEEGGENRDNMQTISQFTQLPILAAYDFNQESNLTKIVLKKSLYKNQ